MKAKSETTTGPEPMMSEIEWDRFCAELKASAQKSLREQYAKREAIRKEAKAHLDRGIRPVHLERKNQKPLK